MIETSRQGVVMVIQSAERLTEDFLDGFQKVIDECLKDMPPMAVLNLESTKLVDSCGLEYLLDANDKFQLKGGAFKLASPNGLCSEVLAITELDNKIEVHEDVNSAVRSFAK